jgi:lysophospholipase L1-like esterase
MKNRISFVWIGLISILINTSLFSQMNPTDTIKSPCKILMMGNSITHMGDWQKVLHRKDVINWGIPGYTTEQLSWTVKNFIELKPVVVFMEGGINDLTLGITPERVCENQIKVIDSLLFHHIIPVVQSTIYQRNSRDHNKRVKKVNKLILEYCSKHQIDYLDLNSVLSENDELKKDITTDGTHLKPGAYILWAELITKELTKLKL